MPTSWGTGRMSRGRETFRQVVATFGEDIVAADGTIDRRVLGGKVFGDAAQLKRLTDIVWPVDS